MDRTKEVACRIDIRFGWRENGIALNPFEQGIAPLRIGSDCPWHCRDAVTPHELKGSDFNFGTVAISGMLLRVALQGKVVTGVADAKDAAVAAETSNSFDAIERATQQCSRDLRRNKEIGISHRGNPE